MQTIAITIRGKVQGVFFRQSTKEKAIHLNIKGTVENLPDGSVYVIASGEDSAIQELIRWCHTGPPRAEVSEVKLEVKPLNTGLRDFYIIR